MLIRIKTFGRFVCIGYGIILYGNKITKELKDNVLFNFIQTQPIHRRNKQVNNIKILINQKHVVIIWVQQYIHLLLVLYLVYFYHCLEVNLNKI